jgi:hypothetical protein
MTLIGFFKPRCFQRLGHFAPLSFTACGGKIQATRCAGGRCLGIPIGDRYQPSSIIRMAASFDKKDNSESLP